MMSWRVQLRAGPGGRGCTICSVCEGLHRMEGAWALGGRRSSRVREGELQVEGCPSFALTLRRTGRLQVLKGPQLGWKVRRGIRVFAGEIPPSRRYGATSPPRRRYGATCPASQGLGG